jgi:hypothetical protein
MKSFLDRKLDLILDKCIEAKRIYNRECLQQLERGDINGFCESFERDCNLNIYYQLITDILIYTNDNFD